MQKISYTDETRTGLAPEYRALRRVTIAARTNDAGEFEWLRRFAWDFLPAKTEPKSELVWSVIRKDFRARDRLFVDLARATIIIIDIAHYIREVVRDAAEAFGFNLTGFGDPIDAIMSKSIPEALARRILYVARDQAIRGTMLGRVEWLVMQAATRAGMPLKNGIINRDDVCGLSTRDFQELAATSLCNTPRQAIASHGPSYPHDVRSGRVHH